MKVERLFTAANHDPYHGVEFVPAGTVLRGKDGSVIESYADVLVPSHWTQTARDILVTKYCRKAGVPNDTVRQLEAGVPKSLQRREPNTHSADMSYGGETDARQVFDRIAGAWAYHGWKLGYFGSEEDAVAFRDEFRYMMVHQIAAPASPQWFNTGLWWAYGITGEQSGLWYGQEEGTKVKSDVHVYPSDNSYQRPQSHACFIQTVNDTLVGNLGITSLIDREARVFKFGGGSGGNFSNIRGRGEPLSGGGKSSGLLSFLKPIDANAGAIKSGGTTRRAAKMIVLDVDHPDIEEFIDWKPREELKVAAMVAGNRRIRAWHGRMAEAHDRGDGPTLATLARKAVKDGVPKRTVDKLVARLKDGHRTDIPEIGTGYEDEGYTTVSGQNANNTVRVRDSFMAAVDTDGDAPLIDRLELTAAARENRPAKPRRLVKARHLWGKINAAAWACACPGLHFSTTINAWNPVISDGEIRASNPCSEYFFVDDTCCNLASLNLVRFDGPGKQFNVRAYVHAVALWTVALDITVSMAGYPYEAAARKSHEYRTLGLGYANLGGLLMRRGVSYDSDEGRATAACLTALMQFVQIDTSANIAAEVGPFPAWSRNRDNVRRVIRNHVAAATPTMAYVGLNIEPPALRTSLRFAAPADLMNAVSQWAVHALEAANKPIRNAQFSLIAPTGTIGLVLDVDTTGIEPDFALVKWKKLAGGGYLKIVNRGVSVALSALGYGPEDTDQMARWLVGTGSPAECDLLADAAARKPGLADRLRAAEPLARGAVDVRNVLDGWRDFGLSADEWDAVNAEVCGRMNLEGHPLLKPEHAAVFDCASRCGKTGTRTVSVDGHLLMMAAVQPFLSGAISKTVNIPNEATEADVAAVNRKSHKLALKANALYRDGSKLSQPLEDGASAFDDGDAEDVLTGTLSPDVGKVVKAAEAWLTRGVRRRLPGRRRGYTQSMRVGGNKVFLRASEYPDGTPGEIFVDMHREGAAFRAVMNAFAIAVSLGLQYGVPMEEFADAFVFFKFEPAGSVEGHDRLKMASSVIDAIFRDLAISYLGRNDLAHVSPDDDDADDTPLEEVSTPPVTPSGRATSELSEARQKGYEGEACGACGAFMMVRSGKCLKCDGCGETSGCS